MYNLEDVGFGRGILTGAFARLKQVSYDSACLKRIPVTPHDLICHSCNLQIKKEREEKAMLNADLPKIPHGSLGSFKRGMQTVPLKVKQ